MPTGIDSLAPRSINAAWPDSLGEAKAALQINASVAYPTLGENKNV
jgi:hypothetical protein